MSMKVGLIAIWIIMRYIVLLRKMMTLIIVISRILLQSVIHAKLIKEQFISLDDPAFGKRIYHTQHFCAECIAYLSS